MEIDENTMRMFQLYCKREYEKLEQVDRVSFGLLRVKLRDGRIGYFDICENYHHVFQVVYRPGDSYEDAWREAFAILFRYLIENQCMRQYTLSELTGIPQATLSTYLKCKANPSAVNVRKIAKALGVPTSFFTDCLDGVL